ncbi:MAG: hypothetical protein AAB692_00410, partial [Patescibacteria group bacterium]
QISGWGAVEHPFWFTMATFVVLAIPCLAVFYAKKTLRRLEIATFARLLKKRDQMSAFKQHG